MVISTHELDYRDGDLLCRGFIAYKGEATLPLPAVMVVHDWGGRGEDACAKARELAELGYVGFAVDMYGAAQTATEKTEKRALMTPLVSNRALLAQRICAAFDFVRQVPQVDKKRIAAIGYCFGGMCVLDLARQGVDIKGVVSFHGLLSAPVAIENKAISAKILILHGYDDPLVMPDQVEQFASEMTVKKVDWQVHIYGHTAHSFTNPLANDAEMGLHYNAQSARRSWQSAEAFLHEVLFIGT